MTARSTTRRPRRPRYTYPLAGTYNVGLRVTDTHGATATDFVGDHRGQHPAHGHDRLPHRGLHVEGRRPDRLRGQRPPTPRTATSPRARSAGRSCSTTAHRAATSTRCQPSPASTTALPRPRPRVSVLSRARRSPPATAAGSPTAARSAWTPKTVDLSFASARAGSTWASTARSLPTPFTRSVIQGRRTRSAPPPRRRSRGQSTTSAPGRTAGVRAHTITATGRGLHRDLHPAHALAGPGRTAVSFRAGSGIVLWSLPHGTDAGCGERAQFRRDLGRRPYRRTRRVTTPMSFARPASLHSTRPL